ncbi:EX3L2 protein, partial [Calcarius ornatus]|nr:EX3L2 protein [Calcarius ornatus]
LGARLAALAARVVGDLGVVRSRVAPEYPPEWGALGVYARGYQRALGQQLRALARRPLDVAEMYLLLEWHGNAYPREVLGHPEVGALLRAQELGPLLPPETQRDLERACIAAVKELQLSEDRWPEDVTSQDMEDGLATRVTGLLRAHADRAPQVTPEFGREMAHSLLGVLVAFLHRWGHLGTPGHTPGDTWGHPGTSGWHTERGVPRWRTACWECCEEPRRQAHAALDRVTRACGHLLTRRLFEELKPHFAKLMKRKWLTSSDAFDAIVMLVTGFAQTLRPLHPEPHQVLVSELHRRVLIEYVRPLLQGRLARQLQELFTRLESASPWLDSVVPRLRELLVLEDTAALQMEVGALARDFPDVRWILGVLQDLGGSEAEPGPPRSRTFFAEL